MIDLSFYFIIQYPLKGNIDIARLLLHYKADVNIPMENGHTPLIISIQQKQMKVFNFLLSEPSINVNQKNTTSQKKKQL